MTWRVIVRPAARAELLEAFRWYEDRQVGLGQDFVNCVDASLASISEGPLAYPRWKAISAEHSSGVSPMGYSTS